MESMKKQAVDESQTKKVEETLSEGTKSSWALHYEQIISRNKFLSSIKESSVNLNHATLALAKSLFHNQSLDTNLVFSPISLHIVLGLMAAGSGDSTQAHLLSFLKYDSTEALSDILSRLITVVLDDGSSSGGPRLSSANGVWVEAIEGSFKKIVEDVYKGTMKQADFKNQTEKVRGEVNLWVKKATEGLIKEILPLGSVTRATICIFANTLYFKGAWTEKFYAPFLSKDHDFHLLNGSSVKTPFMTSHKTQCISAYEGFKVLRIFYKLGDRVQDGRKFSMCFFLPDSIDGLPVLVDKLTSSQKFVEEHIPHSEVKVGDFLIPKFKVSFGFEVSNVLKEEGIVLPNWNIFHKSFIEVDEQGTEAAASTAAVRVMCALAPRKLKTLNFVADHPFLFLLREDATGVVMFIGTVLDPTSISS